MTEYLVYDTFDGRPFGHTWTNPRPGLAYDTPPDPVEEGRLVMCRCGSEHEVGQRCPACAWEKNPLNPQRSGE